MKGLKNKVVIITGAAAGIGKATALRFAEEGANIVIADFADGSAAVQEVTAKGVQAVYAQVNVTDPESVKAMVAKAIEVFGKVDVLINNAGITKDAMMKKMTKEAWDAVIDVNLTGVFNCTSAVLPHLLAQKAGVVLTTSSVVGLYGNLGQTNYAAAKWGVIGMTKSWAKEMARHGLRFNCVAPGFIATEMVKKIPEQVLNEKILIKVPAGRLGEPEEIAAAFAFLASDDAKFINGAVLSVDGACTL
ncbi:beta-ketoacyl-ACP reductase [Sporomusa termitida]|uniref:3-oxoacyl-[acyl-carrier-protein] reductase FabG n=1 Tax=Sporomusa termitida TaxID=2377 RepID=A0A517E0X5_9FIRM|nr:beta-ketoacyl-ACP reductase [Sporomusa termitida]QDR83253.1 3-oxoacyl-[acyl-carrier-protein] reductase FabG [Sporomusa termitida]